MILVPRDTVWPGQTPTNSNDMTRRLLAPWRPYLTIHYTGGGMWLDPGDTADELRQIQRYAQAAGKPWEYNYVIDGQGLVFEYAGDYQAAHSAGDNDVAIGVLLLVGFAGTFPGHVTYWEEPTEPMVTAVRDLRGWLVSTNRLAGGHLMVPHKGMPGAATICPGPSVMARWDDLDRPPTPTPQPPMEDDMEILIGNQAGTVWRLMEDGHKREIGYPVEYSLRGAEGHVKILSESELDDIPDWGEP